MCIFVAFPVTPLGAISVVYYICISLTQILLSPGEIYQDKQLVVRTQQQIFVLGQGGFGGPRNSKLAVSVQNAPKRAPDAVIEQQTAEDQAALYRYGYNFT